MNEYYGAPNDFRGYLEHHGIKGQKWGVKNGPPYPLGAGDHNARERKANWKSSLGSGDEVKKKKVTAKKAEIHKNKKAGGMLDFLKKKDQEDKGSTSIDDLNKMLLNSNASALKDWQNKKAGGMFDFLKKKDKEDKGSTSIDDLNKMLLNSNADAMKQWNNLRNQKVGDMESNPRAVDDMLLKNGIAAMTVTMLGTSYFAPLVSSIIKKVGPNLIDNHITDRDFNEKFKDSEVKTVNDLPKTDGPANTKENARNNNPGYPSEGRTMNCVCCSAAMAMREKGYDVQARASEEPWDTERVMHKMFNNAKYYSNVNSSRVEDTIRRFGNGSYGSLTVYWPQGGGHNMFFKNEGDKIKVYDSQSGKVYSVDDFKDLALPEMNIIRLDQATPNNSVTAFVEPRR